MSNNLGGVIQLAGLVDRLSPSEKGFANSLISQFENKGRLSQNQLSWVTKLIEKATAPKEVAPTTQIENFSRIIEIFDFAKEKEYKKPKIRLGDKDYKIVLSAAPDSGVNAGMIYVKLNDEYKGKISRNGSWVVFGPKDETLLQKLSEFSLEPKEQARRYGFKTGACCICGRKLTDKTSIANGIGPICEEGYGL